MSAADVEEAGDSAYDCDAYSADDAADGAVECECGAVEDDDLAW